MIDINYRNYTYFIVCKTEMTSIPPGLWGRTVKIRLDFYFDL